MGNEDKDSKRLTRETIEAYRSIDYSGFIERLFARGADFAIEVGFGYLVYKKFGLYPAIAAAYIFDLVVRIVMTYFFGCTVGKFLFGVRVVSRCSERLSIWQVLIREFFKYISVFFLNIDYIAIIFNSRKMALHDIAACTAVTSAGKDEAKYAREVYGEMPEKFYWKVWTPITVILILAICIGINRTAAFYLNDKGMIGLTRKMSSEPIRFTYGIPGISGAAGVNKDVIQLGDIKGDGGYDVFREDLSGENYIIRDLNLIGKKPEDGEIELSFPKPIIQYRFLDMDGDEKDELAVLFEDKTVEIYSFGETPVSIGTYTIGYSEIDAFVDGTPKGLKSSRLYIAGDKKVTVLSASVKETEGEQPNEGESQQENNEEEAEVKEKTVEIKSEEYELPGGYNIIDLSRSVLNDEDYLAALTDENMLVLYSFDGTGYKAAEEMRIPIEGELSFIIRDIDVDGENEIVVSSPENEKRPYPVLAAYKPARNGLELMWYGGRNYKIDGVNVYLILEDGADVDNDGAFEAYMISKNISGQSGTYSLHIFESNKWLMKVNNLLRRLSLTKVR